MGILLLGSTSATQLPDQAHLVTHFNANTIVGSNGVKFSAWTDSISGIGAAQATGGNQPTLTTNRLNGLPSAKFDGTAYMTIATPGVLKTAVDSKNYSVMIVYRTLGSTGAGTLFGATADNLGFVFIADGTGTGRGVGGNSYFTNAQQTSFSTLGVAATTASLPNRENIFINGCSVTCESTILDSGGNGFAIGCKAGGTTGYFVNAEIFDILVWNTTLTTTQVLQFQMWACEKYGQTYPWAALSSMLVFDGDSITAGGGMVQYPYKIALSLGLTYGQWTNVGIPTCTVNEMNTRAPSQVDNISALINKDIRLVAFEWFNQKDTHPTPFNNSSAYLAARKAASARTRIVWGDSTAHTGTETDRVAYNNAFAAASTTNIDSFVVISANSNIGVVGAAASGTYFSDGVHLTNAGYVILASLMQAGIAALP